MGVYWPEVEAACVRLCNEGLSMREIGARLKITKDAVAGYCHRARMRGMVVESKHTFGPRAAKPESPTAVKKNRARSRQAANELPGTKPVTSPKWSPSMPMLSPTKTCQFIAGEKGRDFDRYTDDGVFCGAAAMEGSSYCPDHHARTHTRLKQQDGVGFIAPAGGSVDTAWR